MASGTGIGVPVGKGPACVCVMMGGAAGVAGLDCSVKVGVAGA